MSPRLKVLASLAILITLLSFRFSTSAMQSDVLRFAAKQLLKIAILIALVWGGRALIRLFRRHYRSKGGQPPEHAVLLKIKLSGNRFGRPQERAMIASLEDQIIATADRAGENIQYDGNEYGEGFCTLYLYGSNADHVCDLITPTLQKFDHLEGSYVVKRYGPPGATQKILDFNGKDFVESEVKI